MTEIKKNRGIAIERMNRSFEEGKKLVSDVKMSSTWHKAKEQAVDKLLSNQYGNKVDFRSPYDCFFVTIDKPVSTDMIIDEFCKNSHKIFISIKGKNNII